jgi:uncharacterized protein (TIGR03437 family)
MKTPGNLAGLFMLSVASLCGQAPVFHPLHVSAAGIILDDSNKPVALRGLNRSGTASGNADASSTDADYAGQNQLLSMNVVRLFVNATWWNNNVQVPIANAVYQTYIDTLIQRAKKYGNYVVILKAANFPDAPCGANGQNCPAPNQGDLNCAANATLCATEDTTGNTIDAAFIFWSAFAAKYAGDPAILYDTWEDMHSIDADTWSNDQNQLIAAIRSNSAQSLIFVEDTGTAFESIVAGTLPDLSWSNLVWNFHLYAGPAGTCAETASPRYANWAQNFSPLVNFAQQNGHGAGIMEWGGCNDSEPYNTNVTSYALAHSLPLIYFDNTYLITQSGGKYQLTATGAKVAQAYTAIANGGPGTVTSVSSAYGQNSTLAPEAIASAYGSNLATLTQNAAAVPLPLNLGGTSVMVTDANGVSRSAELFYVSPVQVNYEVPPGVVAGTASITLSVNGDPAAFGSAKIAAVSPGVYSASGSGQGVAAGVVQTVHADGTSSTANLAQCNSSGVCTAVPIDLGLATDHVFLELFGTGIRGHSGTVNCQVGPMLLPVAFAGPQGVYVGLDQVNIALPASLRGAGNVNATLSVDGQTANVVGLAFK